MSLTPHAARQVRIWVITLCVIGGAALPFVIPGAVTVRAFTDVEARIGFGAFAVLVHAVIGALIGWGLAEFVVWMGGGAPERRSIGRGSARAGHSPDDSRQR